MPHDAPNDAREVRAGLDAAGGKLRHGGGVARAHGELSLGGAAKHLRSDLALATATVLLEDGHEGRSYDLTGPDAISWADLAGLEASAPGRRSGSARSTTRKDSSSASRPRRCRPTSSS